MTLLAMMSRPNSPLMTEPVASTITSSTPRIALIRVKTLARTMSETLRAARTGTCVAVALGYPPRHLGVGQPEMAAGFIG